MKIRQYQQEALNTIKAKFQQGVNRQLVKMATGTGKTVIFANLPDTLQMRRRGLFIIDREELADQTLDKLRTWNPNRSIAVEMGDRRSNGEQLVVGGVQTLGRLNSARLYKLNPDEFDFIVVDECHSSLGETYGRVLQHFNVFNDKSKLCAGFTATPNRADGKGLGHIYEEIVVDYGILPAIKDGWLVDLKGVKVSTTESLDDLKMLGGDFNTGDLSKKVNTHSFNDLAARAWLEHGDNRQTVVYAVDIDHAQRLAEAFKSYGLMFEAVWGTDPHRREKIQAHKDGVLKGLVNCELLTKGYDDWRIGCIVQCRPTTSELLYCQIAGRGTRIPPDIGNLIEARKTGQTIAKQDCIILDLVCNSSKHSLVTLASLFGLNKDADLKGKKISAVMAELEAAKEKHPVADFSKLLDIDKLKSFAEEVDLFKVTYPAEIESISENQWRKVDNAYVLLLLGGGHLTVLQDLLGKWHIVGTVSYYQVRDSANSLRDAITLADAKVRGLGNRKMALCAKRVLKSDVKAPSPAQLQLCQRLRIQVPVGSTFGEVRRKIVQVIADIKKRRVA